MKTNCFLLIMGVSTLMILSAYSVKGQHSLDVGTGIRNDSNSRVYVPLPDSLFTLTGLNPEPRTFLFVTYGRRLSNRFTFNTSINYTKKYLPVLAGKKAPWFNLSNPVFTSFANTPTSKTQTFYVPVGIEGTFLRRVGLGASIGPAFHIKEAPERYQDPYTPENDEVYYQTQKIHKSFTWNYSLTANLRLVEGLHLQGAYTRGIGPIANDLELNGVNYPQPIYWKNAHLALMYRMELHKIGEKRELRQANKYVPDSVGSIKNRLHLEVGVRDQWHTNQLTILPDSVYTLVGYEKERRNYAGIGYSYLVNPGLQLVFRVQYSTWVMPIIVGKMNPNFDSERPYTTSSSSPNFFTKNDAFYVPIGVQWKLHERFGLEVSIGPALHFQRPSQSVASYLPELQEPLAEIQEFHHQVTWHAGLGASFRFYRGFHLRYALSPSLSDLSKDLEVSGFDYSQNIRTLNSYLGLSYQIDLK